ncbi:AAA family ATPase [Nocardioides cavernae]|uniref:AAA family ATPase n=1 Tax=Nocardioides TaxID=1839 RepID=UPI000A8CB327|nr:MULTISPECIES: AAA family ATPase [Nocardioides]MCK9823917.1 AAA family ATPase [Nocardioides cavernae]
MSTCELVVLFGPPAVGKMTVGRAVCERSHFRLFHNHHTIEPLHEIFGQQSPAFRTLNGEFRRRVIEEAAAHGVPLVVTTVWNLAGEGDAAYLRDLIAPYVDRGLSVRFVELYADLATRLDRNAGTDRLAAKPSKRDLAASDAHVREREATFTMNTSPDRPLPGDRVLADFPHLRLDTTHLSPEEAAARILAG